MKTVVTLGNTPKECSLEIDGKKIENVIKIECGVDLDNGPWARYYTQSGHESDIHDAEFSIVSDDTIA